VRQIHFFASRALYSLFTCQIRGEHFRVYFPSSLSQGRKKVVGGLFWNSRTPTHCIGLYSIDHTPQRLFDSALSTPSCFGQYGLGLLAKHAPPRFFFIFPHINSVLVVCVVVILFRTSQNSVCVCVCVCVCTLSAKSRGNIAFFSNRGTPLYIQLQYCWYRYPPYTAVPFIHIQSIP
jgi:hypothetical protein